MKYVSSKSIRNIKWTDIFDSCFLFSRTLGISASEQIKIIHIWDILKQKKNADIEKDISSKPAMYSNMYSAKDELVIFTELFENALKNKEKIHIIWISLKEEIDMLEQYYEALGYMREDINCFCVDFSIPLITASVHIENLIWKGSDYKAQWKNIFFMPPIRESSQNKALFKGINRGVIAGIYIENFWVSEKEFLTDCITQEKILPLTLGKVLFHNIQEIWIDWKEEKIEIFY